MKVYEIPVVVRSPSKSGFFDEVSLATTIGIGCAGHTLVFQNVSQTLTSAFANLNGASGQLPSLFELASFAASVTTEVVSQLAVLRPDAHGVSLIVGGVDPRLGTAMAYSVRPAISADAYSVFEGFRVEQCDLEAAAYFVGDHVGEAERRLAELVEEAAHPIARERAPLQVVREFINDASKTTIGGSLELGFTMGPRFQRVATVEPSVWGQPAAQLMLNGFRIDDIHVGPCAVGIMGMV
ncbi:hypothetical protein [Nocardioides aquiterrae]|uniref:Uncharacterized protein n=1 Tax=Nocardioides aquiterrae TaxID=203799 RepID=A0ABN1UL19_9ACTN